MTDVISKALDMSSPFDKEPLSKVMKKYPDHCFVAFPNLVIADVSKSNIRESRNMAEHAEKMKWDLSFYEN